MGNRIYFSNTIISGLGQSIIPPPKELFPLRQYICFYGTGNTYGFGNITDYNSLYQSTPVYFEAGSYIF